VVSETEVLLLIVTTAEQKWFNLMPNPMSEEGSSKD
jgi:hypothetical protein